MMNEQLLKTSGADVSSSGEKLRKYLGGVTSTTAPPPLVRSRVNVTEPLRSIFEFIGWTHTLSAFL